MTPYEAIFVRRSVRRYDETPLDAAALSEIKDRVENAKQLPGQSARFEIAAGDEIKGGFAPHAILAHSDDSDAARLNIGYTLQGMDLWLQSIGFGSIWCGMAKPRNASPDYRILLGFGKTDFPLRGGENDFKRKKTTDISNEDNAVARAARLAPSAVNFQPWKLTFAAGKVTVRSDVRGIGRMIPGKLHMFDLGIVLKHVELALEHEGKPVASLETVCDGKEFSVECRFREASPHPL
jgi:nitroreductase